VVAEEVQTPQRVVQEPQGGREAARPSCFLPVLLQVVLALPVKATPVGLRTAPPLVALARAGAEKAVSGGASSTQQTAALAALGTLGLVAAFMQAEGAVAAMVLAALAALAALGEEATARQRLQLRQLTAEQTLAVAVAAGLGLELPAMLMYTQSGPTAVPA